MASSQVLVTGGTGMVGSTLVRLLLREGYSVRVFRRSSSSLALLKDVAHQLTFVEGTLEDVDAVYAAVDGVDEVYHVAAYIGFGGRRDARQLWRVNVQGTAHIVDAVRDCKVRRLVHTSSIAALGRPVVSEGMITENMPWVDSPWTTEYARSKYAAEQEVYRGIAEGIDAVIVNPSLIFGCAPLRENTMQLVYRLYRGKIPAIPSGGTCVVDAEDVAYGQLLAMQRGVTGERYILGGENLTWEEILCTLARALGVDPPRWRMPKFLAYGVAFGAEGWALLRGKKPVITRESVRTASRMYRYDNQKAREKLGWRFRPFWETAQRVALCMKQQLQEEKAFSK